MWFVDLFAAWLPFAKASEDAGANLVDNAAIQHYLTCWLIVHAIKD